jgi:uncharacterized protein Yka (UPF0111/DUF47 family)
MARSMNSMSCWKPVLLVRLKLRKKLFNLEADLPPVNVIFMYNIIDQIGALADTAEMIGNHVELLLAK